MKILQTCPALRHHLATFRQQRIALVPTMGNLHAGHLALVEHAKQQADQVVVSLFVNPLQFAAHEDLAVYPRTLAADQAALEAAGVEVLFVPEVADIYPQSMAQHTFITVPGLCERFCGASRPGHFVGVATVVCKLFNMVQPDVALFGYKDFQQLQVIRQMVTDLALPVEVVGVDTVREPDGLAMSSRNHYLNTTERAIAPLLFAQLSLIGERLKQGERCIADLEQAMSATLDAAGFVTEFVCIVDAATLAPLQPPSVQAVILAAAQLGGARLIDNLVVDLPTPMGVDSHA